MVVEEALMKNTRKVRETVFSNIINKIVIIFFKLKEFSLQEYSHFDLIPAVPKTVDLM